MRLTLAKRIFLCGLLQLGWLAPLFVANDVWAEERVLKIGIHDAWPLVFDKGEEPPEGFALELIDRMVRQLGYMPKYVSGNWHTHLGQLQEGQLDLLFPFALRKIEGVDVVEEPFGIASGTVFARYGQRPELISDLADLRVGVLKDDFFGKKLMELTERLKVRVNYEEFLKTNDAFKAVGDGKIDAAAVELIGGSLRSRNFDLRPTSIQFGYTTAHFAVSAQHAGALAPQLNDLLVRWKSDHASPYYELDKKWFGSLELRPLPLWVRAAILVSVFSIVVLAIILLFYRKELADRTEELSLRERFERIARFNVFHDKLTNFPDEDHMRQVVGEQLRRANSLAMFLVAVDDIDVLVASQGRNFVNDVLKRTSQRMRREFDSGEFIGYLKEGVFVLAVQDLDQPDIDLFDEKLMRVFEKPFEVGNRSAKLEVGIGRSFYPSDGNSFEMLVRKAKSQVEDSYVDDNGARGVPCGVTGNGGNCIKNMFEGLEDRITENNVDVRFLPIVSTDSQKIVGALTRPRLNSAGTEDSSFSNYSQQIGQLKISNAIFELLLQQACYHYNDWIDRGLEIHHVGVPLTAAQLMYRDLNDVVTRVLSDASMDPRALIIEVNAQIFQRDIEHAHNVLKIFRKSGVEVAFDDFGRGVFTPSYIVDVPITILKLSDLFVSQLGRVGDADAEVIATSIIELGRDRNLDVIATGVSSVSQLRILKDIGCDLVEGPYFRNQDSFQLPTTPSISVSPEIPYLGEGGQQFFWDGNRGLSGG